VYVKVTSDENSRGVVAAMERKELHLSKKTEKGLQDLEDKGGR